MTSEEMPKEIWVGQYDWCTSTDKTRPYKYIRVDQLNIPGAAHQKTSRFIEYAKDNDGEDVAILGRWFYDHLLQTLEPQDNTAALEALDRVGKNKYRYGVPCCGDEQMRDRRLEDIETIRNYLEGKR